MDKVIASAMDAVAEITDGASIAVGGFGVCGTPQVLIDALLEAGATNLTAVSNNAGVDNDGLGTLLAAGRISRVIASYVGENRDVSRQFLAGLLSVELTPQGTLAERLRAGGAGIPAFYTATGVGTQVADGGLPWRFSAEGTVVEASPPKEVRTFGGRDYILEEAITTDYALVRAAVADRHGNLVFHASAQNFNPLCAVAARVTIVEAQTIVEAGAIDPSHVQLPGVYVQKVVAAPATRPGGARSSQRTEDR